MDKEFVQNALIDSWKQKVHTRVTTIRFLKEGKTPDESEINRIEKEIELCNEAITSLKMMRDNTSA